jgi:hypothetical protein
MRGANVHQAFQMTSEFKSEGVQRGYSEDKFGPCGETSPSEKAFADDMESDVSKTQLSTSAEIKFYIKPC